MGSFNATCGFSGLPITNDMPVRVMIVGGSGGGYRSDASPFRDFIPFSYLVPAKYDNYGSVEMDDAAWENLSNSFRSTAQIVLNRKDDKHQLGLDDHGDYHQWFIREDVWNLLKGIPGDYDYHSNLITTVGEGIEKLRTSIPNTVSYALENTQLVGADDNKVVLYPHARDVYEALKPPSVYKGIVSEFGATIEALFYEKKPHDMIVRACLPMLDITMLWDAMYNCRKLLCPQILCGQDISVPDAIQYMHEKISKLITQQEKEIEQKYGE